MAANGMVDRSVVDSATRERLEFEMVDLNIQADLQDAELRFERLFNTSPARLRLPENVVTATDIRAAVGAPRQAPELQLSAAELIVARSAVARAEAGFEPRIRLQAGLRSPVDEQDDANGSLGVVVEYVIGDGGRRQSQLESATAQMQRSEAQFTASKQAFETEMNISVARLDAIERSLPVVTLTTGVDAVTGGAGDDSFVGQMDATATLNTLGLLDVVDGGAGTDTLTVINTTANAVSTALTAASVTNIENFVYMATAGGALDFDDAGSATNFSMTVLGASNFTDVRTTDTVTIVNGGAAMDSTYTYNATNVTGTADAHTIAFTSVTAGADLELSGAVETITLDVNGASAFADLVLDAATTAVNIDAGAALTVATTLTATGVVTYTVTGAGAVTLTPALGTATTAYNAAASTGAQTILAGVSNITITGGSAADVIDMGVTLTSNDTIDGGAGADTLRVDLTSLTAGTADHSISNVETLRLDNVTTSGALNMDNLSFSTVRFDSGAAATETITLTDVATSIIAFSFLGAGTANADLLFDEVVIDYDTTTTQAAASFLVNNGGVDADDITIGKIDIDRIEALTVTATDIGTAAADELTIAEIEGDHMTDLVVIADGEVIITDVDLLIGDTFDFTAADGGVAVSISDAAPSVPIRVRQLSG
jgi:hypothetical protein